MRRSSTRRVSRLRVAQISFTKIIHAQFRKAIPEFRAEYRLGKCGYRGGPRSGIPIGIKRVAYSILVAG